MLIQNTGTVKKSDALLSLALSALNNESCVRTTDLSSVVVKANINEEGIFLHEIFCTYRKPRRHHIRVIPPWKKSKFGIGKLVIKTFTNEDFVNTTFSKQKVF